VCGNFGILEFLVFGNLEFLDFCGFGVFAIRYGDVGLLVLEVFFWATVDGEYDCLFHFMLQSGAYGL
jgi:hypothetical protein